MFHIILENVAGKLDERFAFDEVGVRAAVLDLVDQTDFRDGDVIRIVEQEELK